MTALLLVGALVTLAGAGVLVLAFRRGQEGEPAQERRLFRLAVVLLAFGSLSFVAPAAVGLRA